MATNTTKRSVNRKLVKQSKAESMTEDRRKEEFNLLVIPFLILRRTVGVLGVAMPFVLALGGWWLFKRELQPSISAYYHTEMGDVFVGIQFSYAVFLFAYRGYEWIDNVAGYVASAFAAGVALFPTLPVDKTIVITPAIERAGTIHYVSAALLFITLSFFSLHLFTKTKKDAEGEMTTQKRQRNWVYIACGAVMLLCIALMGIYFYGYGGEGSFLGLSKPVFVLETAAVIAFGVSWFIKGDTLLRDK
jgi:hypothetical protein